MKNNFGRYFVTLCTALVVGLVAFGYLMSIFDDANATDGEETIEHTIEAPLSDGGFTVSELPFTTVFDGGSFTFTITSLSDSHSPNVTLNTIYGLLQFTGQSENVFSYNVSNILGPITADDFTVTMLLNKYTVHFDDNNSGWINPINDVAHGSTISKPADPNKQWHNFEGWYTGDDLEWNFTNPITSNITLFAKFKPYRFNINVLDEGKDTFSGSYDGVLVHDYGIGTWMSEPTRDGYVFKSWLYSNGDALDGGRVIHAGFVPQLIVDEIEDGMTINIYAVWELETFNITYENLNIEGDFNPSWFNSNMPTTYTIESPRIIIPSNAENEQYRFLGWFTDVAGTQPITLIEAGSFGNKTIYAKWAEHTFKINRANFDPDNPTLVDSDGKINFSDLPYVLEALSDTENWDFGFWLFENGNVIIGQTLDYDDFVNREITIKAHWIGKELTVTFTTDTNKGSFSDNQATRETTVNYGSYALQVLPTPVKGWIFVRWMNGDQPFNPITDKVTESCNLVAEWKLDTSVLVPVIEKLEKIDLEEYRDVDSAKLNALIALIDIANGLISDGKIEDTDATPEDVSVLKSQLDAAIDALMGEQIEALAKAEALYYLELLEQDVLAYLNHDDYEWEELDAFASSISDVLDNTANYTSAEIQAIIDGIITFFKGKSTVEMHNEGGYERPEEPFTYADQILVQQLTTLVSDLEPFSVERKELLTDHLFNIYQQRVGLAHDNLNFDRVTNSQLHVSIAQLTQLKNWINAHIALLASEGIRSEITDLAEILTEDYVENAQLWQEIGATLKTELETLILNAKVDLQNTQLLQDDAILIITNMNLLQSQIDAQVTAKHEKDQAYANLQNLITQVDGYVANMIQGINKIKLTSILNNAKAVLLNGNSKTSELIDAKIALQTAHNSILYPSTSPEDENTLDMMWLILIALLVTFVCVLLFVSYPSIRKIKNFKKETQSQTKQKLQKEEKS